MLGNRSSSSSSPGPSSRWTPGRRRWRRTQRPVTCLFVAVASAIGLSVGSVGATAGQATSGASLGQGPNKGSTVSDRTSAQGEPLSSVACTSVRFCVAVDQYGRFVRYDGSKWSPPASIDDGIPLIAVSCASSAFCATVAGGPGPDGEAFLYGGATKGWSPPVEITPGSPSLQSVSCPSLNFCMAADATSVVTYNGTTWSAPAIIDSTAEGIAQVSCISAKFCVEVEYNRLARWFNGKSWAKQVVVSRHSTLRSVSCVSPTFCVALNDAGYTFVFNGKSWSGATNTDQAVLKAMDCVTATFCMAVGDQFAEVFNGKTWSTSATIAPAGSAVDAVSCISATFCDAVDLVGDSIVYTSKGWSPPVEIDPAPSS